MVVTLEAEADIEAIREQLSTVMGIAHFELVCATEPNMDAIKTASLKWSEGKQFDTLKVETKRANKNFPLTSPEISAEIGAHLLKHTTALRADMHNPDLVCWIELWRALRTSIRRRFEGLADCQLGPVVKSSLCFPAVLIRLLPRGG